ncbi:MAG TPA: ATP-binding protein [Propionibacteriaceae bacterium]|nr:ATP-binding protein [Propionibacteriaceae bacterium]
MAEFRRAESPASVTLGIAVLIGRMMAGYNAISWLPSVPYAGPELLRTQWWWVAVFCTGLVSITVLMVVRAVRAQSVRGPAVAYALLTLGAVATAPWGLPEVPAAREPWIWWLIGPSVVCAAIWAGLAWGTAYGAVLGFCFAVFRSTSAGGSADLRTAISQGLFAPAAALAIAAVALGMLKAARRADDLAQAAYAREAVAAVDRALAAEREDLDRLVHDDVLTTLTAAAHAEDRAAVEATKSLASATLVKLEALCSKADTDGAVTLSGLVQLAQTSALQVSPAVVIGVELPESLNREKLPAVAAEALLASTREALRNAVRHAQPHHIAVSWRAVREGAQLRVSSRVEDDGAGFDVTSVPADRLGLRLSMTERMRDAGGSCSVSSEPGEGTTVELAWTGASTDPDSRMRTPRPRAVHALPADFPVAQLVTLTWLLVGMGIFLGLLNANRFIEMAPAVLAMVAMCVLAAVILHAGRSLRLPTWAAVSSVALTAVVAGLMDFTLPRDRWPDAALWHFYPLQLVLVVLAIRRRIKIAILGLLVLAVCYGWWSLRSEFGWTGLVIAVYGPAVFLLLAVIVTRRLRAIARRQDLSRHQEIVAAEESAGWYAARVQRSLWVADLIETASATLTKIAAADRDIPVALKTEARLLEAGLREALVARNVMSDELADVTDAARRRGVSVTFVDSRRGPVPPIVGRAVTSEVRAALESSAVQKVVVRLGPGPHQVTSVVYQDGPRTRLTTIDEAGNWQSEEIESGG